MNALAELRNLPLTKLEQQNYADMAILEIIGGEVDPLEADLRLKAMEEVIKKIREDCRVKSAVNDEAEKYGKDFVLRGVKIQVKHRTVKDFSNCGDPVYNDLKDQSEKIKAMIKAREATIAAGADPATGEVFAPPQTSTTTYLQYNF